MAKILVIPDIHNRTTVADKIMRDNAGKFDKVVFLGDFFDDFGDGPAIAKNTAFWLRDLILKKEHEIIFILGNHDLAYMTPYNPGLCSHGGFTRNKAKAIGEIMADLWDNFKLHHYEDGFHFSHAGITSDFIPLIAEPVTNAITPEYISKVCGWTLARAKAGQVPPLLVMGRSRGGFHKSGGIIWADWTWDFEPIEGMNQIVGHTPYYGPRRKAGANTINYCLDTPDTGIYGLLENGKLQILSTAANAPAALVAETII